MLRRQIEEEGSVGGDEKSSQRERCMAQLDRYEKKYYPANYNMRTGEVSEWIDGEIIWGTREELDEILRDHKEKNDGR